MAAELVSCRRSAFVLYVRYCFLLLRSAVHFFSEVGSQLVLHRINFLALNAVLFDCCMHYPQFFFWKWRKCRLVEMAANSVSKRFACFCLFVLAAHAVAILTPLCWLLCINCLCLFSVLSSKTQGRSCGWALLQLLWVVRLVVHAPGGSCASCVRLSHVLRGIISRWGLMQPPFAFLDPAFHACFCAIIEPLCWHDEGARICFFKFKLFLI